MLKRLLLSLLLLLLIVPLTLHAQETEPEVLTFTTTDGLLTFEYPADWFVEERLYAFMNTVVIVNQEEMLPMVSTAYLLPDQAVIMVQVFPLSEFGFAGISDEISIEDLEAALTQLMGAGSPADEVKFSTYERPDYEAMAGELYIAQQETSAYGVWILPGSGILIQVAIVMRGKVEIPYVDVIEMIADTISFSGRAEDIGITTTDSEDNSEVFEEIFAEWMANDQHNQEILEQMEVEDK